MARGNKKKAKQPPNGPTVDEPKHDQTEQSENTTVSQENGPFTNEPEIKPESLKQETQQNQLGKVKVQEVKQQIPFKINEEHQQTGVPSNLESAQVEILRQEQAMIPPTQVQNPLVPELKTQNREQNQRELLRAQLQQIKAEIHQQQSKQSNKPEQKVEQNPLNIIPQSQIKHEVQQTQINVPSTEQRNEHFKQLIPNRKEEKRNLDNLKNHQNVQQTQTHQVQINQRERHQQKAQQSIKQQLKNEDKLYQKKNEMQVKSNQLNEPKQNEIRDEKIHDDKKKSQQVEVIHDVREVHQDSSALIDINHPIQIISNPVPKQTNQKVEPPSKNNFNMENRVFTMVESEEISGHGSMEINPSQSVELPQQKVQMRESISFSDLNYSPNASVDNYGTKPKQIVQCKEKPLVNQNIKIEKERLLQPILQIKPIEVHNDHSSQQKEICSKSGQKSQFQSIESVDPLPRSIVESSYNSEIANSHPILLVGSQDSQQVQKKMEDFEVLKPQKSEVSDKIQEKQTNIKANPYEPDLKVNELVQQKVEQVEPPKLVNKGQEGVYIGPQRKEPKKQQPSITFKLLVSSFAGVTVGGLTWWIGKSTRNGLAVGALTFAATLIFNK